MARANTCLIHREKLPIATQWLIYFLSKRLDGRVSTPSDPPEPSAFLRAAAYHRVLSTIASEFCSSAPTWAEKRTLEQVKAAQQRASLRGLTLLSALIELNSQLDDLSVPFINLKGLTLSQTLR